MARALREQGQARPVFAPDPGPQLRRQLGVRQLHQHRQGHGLEVAEAAEAQPLEALLQARGQVRQAAQGVGREEDRLPALPHPLQVVLGPGGELGGGGAQGEAAVALPAVPLGQLPPDALGGVCQRPEEALGALELHQRLAQAQQLPLGGPLLQEVPQGDLGLPPDLGGRVQHPQPRHRPQRPVQGQTRRQPPGPRQAVHEPEAGRARRLLVQEGQGPVPQGPVPATGQLERQLRNPHRQHQDLRKGSKYGEFLAKNKSRPWPWTKCFRP